MVNPTARPRPLRIGILAHPGVQSLDVTGPFEVFAIASGLRQRAGQASGYRVEVLAGVAGPLRAASGLGLIADRSIDRVGNELDTLLVAGGAAAEIGEPDPALLRFLVRSASRVRRLGSVCTGAFLLAAAGLLDGRRATTHWGGTERLAREYPQVEVERDAIYVCDGNVYSSAGITAGMDLALALVEEDFGRELALAVARQMVLFLKRPGGQSQFSEPLRAQANATGAFEGLPGWIVGHLSEDLSVEVLASHVAISPRHFARVFRHQFGTTPAKFVEALRVDRARELLEDTGRGLEEVASLAGFGSAERMRRSFQRRLNVVPQRYGERFRAETGRPR